MLGIIVTGHGQFSFGISSALQLIIGDVENYKYVNFLEGASADDLFEDLMKVIKDFESCDEVIILSDLAGGSPYKCAIQCSLFNEKVRVIAGVNFPTILELVMNRDNEAEMNEILNKSVQTGKDQLFIFNKEVINSK